MDKEKYAMEVLENVSILLEKSKTALGVLVIDFFAYNGEYHKQNEYKKLMCNYDAAIQFSHIADDYLKRSKEIIDQAIEKLCTVD